MHLLTNPNTALKPPAVLIIGPPGSGKSDLARYLVDLTGWQLYNRAQISRQFMFDNSIDAIKSEVHWKEYNARLVGERRRLLATGLPLIFNGQGYTNWSKTRADMVAAKHVPFIISLNLLPAYVETLATASNETPEDIETGYLAYKRFSHTPRNHRDVYVEINEGNDHDRLRIAAEGLQAYIEAYPKVENTPDVE